jgi:hypothetical protein
LADAHVLAIRKLLLPVLPHTLFAPPGPPLPAKHPSASLLAKLYLHVASLYTSARALFKVHPAPSTNRKLFKDTPEIDTVEGGIVPPLKRYLRKESQVALALAHKWLGVDAGENGKGSKVGEAVAWVKESRARLDELDDGGMREKMKGFGLGKANERKKEERRARKGRVEREVEDVAAWLRAYTRMNDTVGFIVYQEQGADGQVAFQPVPPVSSLVTPSGRSIFNAKPYTPPPSRFGPARSGDGEEKSTYAGTGKYF